MTARAASGAVRSAIAASALAGLALLLPVGWARAALPAEFFGVVPQAPPTARDFERMGRLGLTVRIPIYWFQVEPEPGRFDFSTLDELVGGAAAQGVRVAPFVWGSPSWIGADPARPPLSSGAARRAWAGFLGRLAKRYGPGGTFWRGRPARWPIRRWQVWNEPNFVVFWQPRPSPAGYARLLDISARSIRRHDRGAAVVAAGVAPIEGGMRPWEFLRRLYRVPGVEGDFDLAALHPYSPSLRGVEYQVRRVRRVMARAGDGRSPLLLSEVGVASASRVPSPMSRGRRGQALFLERTFTRLAELRGRWRIGGVDWFAWQDGPSHDPHCVFCQFAGLFDLAGAPKPAWEALRRSVLTAHSEAVR